MRILFWILIITALGACNSSRSNVIPAHFEINDETLTENWDKGNAEYIRYYINSLADSTITDCEFEDRVGELVNKTLYIFCRIDCGDSLWLQRSLEERLLARKIITLAHKEYMNSCLFMKKKEWYACSGIDLIHYCEPSLLNDPSVVDSLRNDLKKICYNCSTIGGLTKWLFD